MYEKNGIRRTGNGAGPILRLCRGRHSANQSVHCDAAGGFPYKITQPGSYRLSGNPTVPDANTTAIQVLADNVIIDLNGFSIIGPVVCTGSPVTSCSPTPTNSNVNPNAGVDGGLFNNITVVNGTVRGMGRRGIFLEADRLNMNNRRKFLAAGGALAALSALPKAKADQRVNAILSA